MNEKGLDSSLILTNLFNEGFFGGIDIGTVSSDLEQRVKLLAPFPSILLSAGIGPWGASEKEKDINLQLAELIENIKEFPVKFIGEIGLDYYWKYGTVEKQQTLFSSQLQLANELSLPVIIHNREADRDTQELLLATPPCKGGILHCFSGDQTLLQTALELDFFISFAGNITYSHNENLRELIKTVPRNRLLLETDSPYLPPMPVRGKANHPGQIIHTYKAVSDYLNLEYDTLVQVIKENFISFVKR